jgi:hypothetical protein
MEKQSRSPRYPQVSLREALTRINEVYIQEGRHKADKEVVAKDLGYSGINGASLGMIAALKHFGLLESAGDGLRVSDDAIAIIELPRNDPQRAAAIRKAAYAPKLFAELDEMYGAKPPSDENLRLTLIKRGFNPNAATSIVRTYRDTISLVDEETEGYTSGSPEPMKRSEDVMSAAQPQAHSLYDFFKAARPDPIQPPQESGGTVLSFKISQDSEARIVFSGHVTQEAIEKLIRLLDVSKDTFPTKAQAEALPMPVETTNNE